MSNVGTGAAIYSLRKKIQEIKSEIDSIGTFEASPELIESANTLRLNEFLYKKSQKQAELADTYLEYTRALEEMLSTVFEIQNGLKDVLKEQSSLLSRKKPKRHQTKNSKKTALKHV